MRIPSPEDVIRAWAERWKHLHCWTRRDLVSKAKMTAEPYNGQECLGRAWACRLEILVYVRDSLTDSLSTVLHELAHLDTPGTSHGQPWKTSYARAVHEVTGILIPDSGTIKELDDGAEGAMAVWWRSSGNHFALNLLTGNQPLALGRNRD